MFQFPANPIIGQVFTPFPGLSYTWNGKGWAPPSFSVATTPMLFADGTLTAPGISWANETNAGFRRVSTGTFQSVVGSNWIYGWNATGFTLNTGVGFYAGAATFSGTVTGITSAMVGLGNVRNEQQIWNYAPGNASIQMAWTGSQIAYSLNSGGGSTLWPIDITGQSRAVWTPQGVIQYFNWVGQGGQPTWLWGTESGQVYLYNPSNFHVRRSTDANNADAVNGVSGWSYGDWGNNPAYLWATEGGSNQQHLTRPQHLSVNYANSSNYANSTNDSTHHEGYRIWQVCRSENDWGKVGLSGDNLDYPLMRNSGNSHRWIATNDDHTVIGLRVFWDDGNASYMLYFRGDQGGFAGRVGTYSDERLKRDIAPATVNATGVVQAMQMFEFNWTRPDSTQRVNLGFSAQNLRALDPSMVFAVPQPPLPKPEELPPDAPPIPDPHPFEGLDEVLSINSDKILAYTVKAVQEILIRLDKLETR